MPKGGHSYNCQQVGTFTIFLLNAKRGAQLQYSPYKHAKKGGGYLKNHHIKMSKGGIFIIFAY